MIKKLIMETRPAFAGYAQVAGGINEGIVCGLCVYAERHAGISQAKAELRAIIDSNNKPV